LVHLGSRRTIGSPRIVLLFTDQGIRTYQRRHHDESKLFRVVDRFRRLENDDGTFGPIHPSLPYR